jgi:hypothetical protein
MPKKELSASILRTVESRALIGPFTRIHGTNGPTCRKVSTFLEAFFYLETVSESEKNK